MESHVQMAEIVRLGCDYAQGYLFSKPLRREEVSAFVRDLESGESSASAGAA